MALLDRLTSYKYRLEFKLRRKVYEDHACSTAYDWDWRSMNFNRIALVNLLVHLSKGLDSHYLEVGCAGNVLFDSVFAKRKVGVDPKKGGTNRETSDRFFGSNEEKFDVIFIDGLHEYEQVRKDALNALSCLNSGGWIAFHDFLPRNWGEHHVPRLQGTWSGDCWKLAMELAGSESIDFRILNIDRGVGVMRPRLPDATIVDLGDELRTQEYDYFAANLHRLPRVDWQEGVEWIRECSRER